MPEETMRQKVILKGRSAGIMSSVMNAIIPPGGPFRAGASDYNLIPRANEVLRSYNPAIAGAFPLILLYVQISSLPRTGKVFTSLAPERASRFLEGMEHSPFYYRRMTALILKLITCLVFYEIDEAAEQIGYKHGCHLKPAHPGVTGGSMKQKGGRRS
jgi:hypothetical protein